MLLSVEELSVRFHRRQPASFGSFFKKWRSRPIKKMEEAPWILKGLSLKVEQNDFLVILGPSGSGKTTLLRAIGGLVKPSSGRIVLKGNDITKSLPHRRDLALAFQNGGWYDHLTVLQHFQLDSLPQTTIEQTLQQLELTDVKYQRPGELSGGQAQRLAIGRALHRSRSLLMLDEPLSQLDQSIRESIRDLLRKIHAEQRTLIYVTHDQQEAMHLATKIAVLHAGRIQQIGSPQELFDAPNHRCVAELIGLSNMQFFNANLTTEGHSRLITLLKSGNAIADIETVRAIECAMKEPAGHVTAGCGLHVGIRPESWGIEEASMIAEEANSPASRVNLMATLVDERFLGHQRQLQFLIPGSNIAKIQVLKSRLLEKLSLVAGARYRLSVAVKDLHFFDSVTRKNLSSSLTT